jgi:hypothetical protein
MKTLQHKIQKTRMHHTSSVQLILKICFVILAVTLVTTLGPAALRTLTDASSLLLQIFLETCRISLFVLTLFIR